MTYITQDTPLVSMTKPQYEAWVAKRRRALDRFSWGLFTGEDIVLMAAALTPQGATDE